MHRDARIPSLAPLGLRLLGRPSADPHDIGARLDRALHVASRDRDGRAPYRARPVQVVAEAHRDRERYQRWRERRLVRVSGAFVPELRDGEWACVLWAITPSVLADFALGAPRAPLDAPLVGRFAGEVTVEIGLAATLVAWLEGQRAVLLAPPLLGDVDGPYRLTALRRAWPLAPPALPDGLGEADGR